MKGQQDEVAKGHAIINANSDETQRYMSEKERERGGTSKSRVR